MSWDGLLPLWRNPLSQKFLLGLKHPSALLQAFFAIHLLKSCGYEGIIRPQYTVSMHILVPGLVQNLHLSVNESISLTLSYGNKITSSHTALLIFTHIPPAAIKCHIFKYLREKILISIDQLCDANMTETFTADKLYICKEEEVAL